MTIIKYTVWLMAILTLSCTQHHITPKWIAATDMPAPALKQFKSGSDSSWANVYYFNQKPVADSLLQNCTGLIVSASRQAEFADWRQMHPNVPMAILADSSVSADCSVTAGRLAAGYLHTLQNGNASYVFVTRELTPGTTAAIRGFREYSAEHKLNWRQLNILDRSTFGERLQRQLRRYSASTAIISIEYDAEIEHAGPLIKIQWRPARFETFNEKQILISIDYAAMGRAAGNALLENAPSTVIPCAVKLF